MNAYVEVDTDDGITTTAENLTNDPDTGGHAYNPIATTIPGKVS